MAMEKFMGILLGALAWLGKLILILFGISFILAFVAMVIYVLKHDNPAPRPLTEEETGEQAKALREVK